MNLFDIFTDKVKIPKWEHPLRDVRQLIIKPNRRVIFVMKKK